MSYILDALKKNQAEQAESGVNLQPPRQGTSRWLAAGLVIVLVINLGLLAWIFLDKSLLPGAEAPTADATSEPMTLADEESPVPDTVQPTAATTSESAAAVAVEPPTETADAPATAESPAPDAPQPARRERSVQPTALAELPAQEQILYNGFNYSTHIYTDDPTLCAVVIDGQRLTAGDSFKGLSVIAITETGVIFEETRRGQKRQVEVSVLEQWERQ